MEDALIISKFANESTREEAFNQLLTKYQQKNILACEKNGH